jgi:hypothetical protein
LMMASRVRTLSRRRHGVMAVMRSEKGDDLFSMMVVVDVEEGRKLGCGG